jgi:hypothetical protein
MLHLESKRLREKDEKGKKETKERKQERLGGKGGKKYAGAAGDAFVLGCHIPALQESIMKTNEIHAAAATARAATKTARTATAARTGANAAPANPTAQTAEQVQHAKIQAKALKAAAAAKNATSGKKKGKKAQANQLAAAIEGVYFYDSGDESANPPVPPSKHMVRKVDNKTKYRTKRWDSEHPTQTRHVCGGNCPTGTGFNQCYDAGFLNTATVAGLGKLSYIISTVCATTGEPTTPTQPEDLDFTHHTWYLPYVLGKIKLMKDGGKGEDPRDFQAYWDAHLLAESVAAAAEAEGPAEEDADYNNDDDRIAAASAFKPTAKKSKGPKGAVNRSAKRQRSSSPMKHGACDPSFFTNYSQISSPTKACCPHIHHCRNRPLVRTPPDCHACHQ